MEAPEAQTVVAPPAPPGAAASAATVAGAAADIDALLLLSSRSEGPPSMPLVCADQQEDASAFECNICLDLAKEPVVTLCGHLYCWPCLYT
mmetsp:Transcript_29724/g.87971  ORF Transcript_29724/g.87971 Transcript_29724/m.87971 type:complete len:91 (-) Transcript_29724:1840-2112(-)